MSKKPHHGELPEPFVEAGQGDDVSLREALTSMSSSQKSPPQLLRERLLATVARPRLRFAPLFGALSELFDLGEADLAGIFERAAAPDAWTNTPIAGTELLHLIGGPRVAHADNGLVRVRAAQRFPQHRHMGLERVLVLDGSYRDEPSGKIYRAGDFHEMPEGSSHAYVALPERTLLLAVSVVRGVDVEGFGALSRATK
jgi:quercetin dioxygenase-like cupin family protein